MGNEVDKDVLTLFKAIKIYYSLSKGDLQKITASNVEIDNNRAIFTSDEILEMVPNTSLIIHFYTSDGIYITNALFIKLIQEDDKYKYITTYPTQGSHSQRRMYYRTNLKCDITLEVNTLYDDFVYYTRSVHNISAGGFSFMSPTNKFPQAKSIKATFKLGDNEINCKALFIHATQINKTTDYPYMIGFSFTNISKENTDIISKQCFLYQIEQRKNKTL